MAAEEQKNQEEKPAEKTSEAASASPAGAGNAQQDTGGLAEDAQTSSGRPVSLTAFVFSLAVLFLLSTGIGFMFYYNVKAGISGLKGTNILFSGQGDRWIGPVYPLGNITASLADGKRCLSVSVSIELNNEDVAKEARSKEVQLVDAAVRIISSGNWNGLDSEVEQNSLKRGILDEINSFLTSGRAVNIYFSEFIVSDAPETLKDAV